jgi:hypothetical protein
MSDLQQFLNTPLSKEAEQARRERDGEPDTSTVTVKVVADHAIAFDGKVYEPGSSFTAPLSAVRDAAARGLVQGSRQTRKRS